MIPGSRPSAWYALWASRIFCKVEFRRGADDHPYLMEINARLTADRSSPYPLRIDVPYMMYQWANPPKSM